MTTVLSFGDITTDGNPDAYGVTWTCQAFTGWGSPGATLNVAQRQQDHGGWGGNSFLRPRVLAAAGRLVAPDQATARDAVDRLCVAVSLDATTLVVSEAGVDRQASVRRDDDVLTTWDTDRIVTWSIQLIAQDPRRYATTEVTASTGLPSSTGGLTWPVTWPAAAAPLNSNPYFEAGISPWATDGGGGTLASSGTQHHEGTLALRVTPDGVTAGTNAIAEEIPVTVGVIYTASAWLWSTASQTWGVGIAWYNSSHTFLSTTKQTGTLSAGVWTSLGGSFAAPAGAAFGRLLVEASGTPAASNILYVDEAVMSSGFTGGLTWPATVTSGVLGVDLDGNIATRPRFVITGPCTNPVITLVGSGNVLSWDLDLAAGQFLDIDVDRRTSLINGQVSRSGAMTSRGWFDLAPGHSDIAFAAASFNPTALLTVVARSAWL